MALDEAIFWMDLSLAGFTLASATLAAAEISFRFGRQHRSATDDEARSQFTATEASVLAVVGLLLGFTFSMAAGRFETRKQIIVQECNAIGTSFLRARLLPEPQRDTVESLYRDYVEQWVAARQAGSDAVAYKVALAKMNRIEHRIWEEVTDVASRSPSPMTALVVASVNDVIDRRAELCASLANRVPGAILVLLFLASVVATGLIGYGNGLTGRRNVVGTVAIACLITAIVVVVLDLDRMARGLIRVDDQQMAELREQIRKR